MGYELTKETIVQDALDMGFTHAGLVDVTTLEAREEVRDMCAVDKCHGYDRNWSCPPGCGTIPECNERMHSYDWGIITQVTLDMEDAMDMEAWGEAGKQLHECLNLTGNVNARNRCIPQCTDHEIVRKTDRKGDQILKGDRNRQLDQ